MDTLQPQQQQMSLGIPFFTGADQWHDNSSSYTTMGGRLPPEEAKNTTGLKTQLSISITLGIFSFLIFCVLRTRWTVMFAPRTKLRRHTPPILSQRFFAWIPQLLRIPEAELLECVGLDAVMLLRFFLLAIKLFSVLLIPGLLIILPVNYYNTTDGKLPTDPDDDDDNEDWFGFQASWTRASKATSLSYLFTHYIFTWIFSLLTLYALWRTYEEYIQIRRSYQLRRSRSIPNRTVMVDELPSHLQTDKALATFYETLGVGVVESAHVVRHVSRLKRLIEQRTHALRMLEKAYTDYYGNPSGRADYDPEKIEEENNQTTEILERVARQAAAAEGSQGTVHEEDGVDHDEQEDDDETHAGESDALLGNGSVGVKTKGKKPKKRPTMRLGFLGLFGKKVDKINHLQGIFATLDRAVQKLRLSRIYTTTNTGFVTFEDMHSAQVLAQTVNTKETLSCKTSLAPEPRDIFWDNVDLPANEQSVRTIVVNVATFVVVFLSSGPIAVLSTFLNLRALEHILPGIGKIADIHPLLKSLLQGFLPTIGLVVFLALVPKILQLLCESQGIQSRSGIARSMVHKYFLFVLVNVLLVFTISGTALQTFYNIYHNPGELALTLATSLPKVAPFFVNFIILKGIGIFPLQLLQLGEVFQQVFHSIRSKTPRDYAEARAPPEMHYGVVYPNALLVFVVILVYSCIQPVILFFGVIYYSIGFTVFKYQLLYVYFHPYESAGQTWPMVYNRIIIGLLIFQTTMLGLFMLKSAFVFGAMLAPLLLVTMWFWYWTTDGYRTSSLYMPLELLRPTSTSAAMAIAAQAAEEADDHEEHPPQSTSFLSAAHAVVIGTPSSEQGPPVSAVRPSPLPKQAGNVSGSGSDSAAANGNGTGVTPVRRMPKSVVDEDDYEAVPDRYTDYRQPPMTLYPGVLNSGRRHYGHPALTGALPTLWLPLQKASIVDKGKGTADGDEEARIGGSHHIDGDDSDHEHLAEALAKPPLKLPSRPTDDTQTFDQSDNLVGGGQDEPSDVNPGAPSSAVAEAMVVPRKADAPSVVSSSAAAVNIPAPSSNGVAIGSAGDDYEDDDSSVVTGEEDSLDSRPTSPQLAMTPGRNEVTEDPTAAAGAGIGHGAAASSVGSSNLLLSRKGSVKTRNPGIDGVKDVYYHHPERRLSTASLSGSAGSVPGSLPSSSLEIPPSPQAPRSLPPRRSQLNLVATIQQQQQQPPNSAPAAPQRK